MAISDRAILVCLLLGAALLIGVGTTVAENPLGPETNQTPVQPLDIETSERLTVTSGAYSAGTTELSIDPGTTISMEFDRLSGQYEAHRTSERIAGETNATKQYEMVVEARTNVSEAIVELYEKERSLILAYHTGEIDEREFVYQLTTLHQSAISLEAQTASITSSIRHIDAPARANELAVEFAHTREAELDLGTFQGHVRSQVVAILAGEGGASPNVWMAVTPTDYELTTVTEEGEYLREGYVQSQRSVAGTDRFGDLEEASPLAREYYPWVIEAAFGEENDIRGSLYWMSVDHSHGTTVAYFDANTELPFRDSQQLNLMTLSTETAVDDEVNGIEIRVDRTYVGGPASVSAVNETGVSVIDEVQVIHEDRQTARLSGEGWFIAPGTSFELVIEVDNRTISVPVTVPPTEGMNSPER